MRFGINTWLFTSPFTNEDVTLFPMFKKWGFDSVEIALEDVTHIDPVLIKKVLADHELSCGSICAAMGSDRDLRGNQRQQNKSLDYLKGVLDIMPELDCHVLAGPLYSSVGRTEIVSEHQYNKQWDIVVKHLFTLSEYASQLNVEIAIEPLNRYESDFINTCEQGLRMIDDVGHGALKLHLDSFHMNIEEKDPAKTILNAGTKLGHFHACGSDRGTPGNDHIDWEKISRSLQQINYDGEIVIESFTQDVKVIAKAASIWRKMEPSKNEIAVKGLAFLRSCLN